MPHAPQYPTSLGRLAAAAALALLALVASLAIPRAAAAAEYDVPFLSGHGDWGVKESFRNYVGGPIAHGDIAALDGATANADGSFRFPVVGGGHELATHAAEIEMEGTVRFRGHETPAGSGNWLLWMTISNPRVTLDPLAEEGKLYADVVSKSLEDGEEESFPGVELAALDLSEVEPAVDSEGGSWGDIPAVLTEAGEPAFSGFYEAGEELDPVDLLASSEPREEEGGKGGDGSGGDGSGENIDEPEGDDRVGTAAPTARRPLLKRLRGRARPVARNGVAALALVGCRPPRPCVLRTRRFAAVKVGRRAFRARVFAPKAVKAGGWASVRLWLPPRQRRVLAGRHGYVVVPVVVRSGGQRVVRRLGAVLRSVPARGGRVRAAR